MNYVDRADSVMKKLYEGNRSKKMTTSQIRNLLSSMSDIYNDVVRSDEVLSPELVSRIQYLKVQFIYEYGRDETKCVQNFMDASGIINEIDKIGDSKQRFIDTERYMEALVAYHRYYGGKDQ